MFVFHGNDPSINDTNVITETGAASELGLALIGAPPEGGSPSSIAEHGSAQEQDREQDLRQDRVQDQHQDQDQDQDQEQEPHRNLGSRYASPPAGTRPRIRRGSKGTPPRGRRGPHDVTAAAVRTMTSQRRHCGP